MLEVLASNGRRKGATLAGKEEVKLTLFVDDTVTYESTCETCEK